MNHLISRFVRTAIRPFSVVKPQLFIGYIGLFFILTACDTRNEPFALSDITVISPDLNSRQQLVEQLAPGQMMYFWASWCAPCIPQLIALNDTTDEKRKRYFLINIDESPDVGVRFLEQRALKNITSVYWPSGGDAIAQRLLGNSKPGIPLTMRVEEDDSGQLRLTEVTP